MSDKIRLIYNKIENRIDEICDDDFVLKENQQEYETFTDLEDFINSFPKEPTSKDLIEEINKIWKTCNPIDEGMGVETANIHIEQFDDIARHFAEWQKQQMMKDAVEAEVMYPASSSTLQIRYKLPKNTKLKYGDKVKIIIVKNVSVAQ